MYLSPIQVQKRFGYHPKTLADSQNNLPFMFGDVGCGHITQCKTHKTQVAFGWACG
ncbi:hypothetical protein SAMD00079811_08120 [Scytonema sp. HK-05]|nr:hypothetical protein SAMD00079811_08120 [Scytonema sp. HK-05]